MLGCVGLDHLKLFRDIARERSVTRGARRNGISQSAASQQLQELERSFDLSLIDRHTRPLKLTEAGRLYDQFCQDVLRRQELLNVDLDRLRERVEGTVRVASIYSVGLSEMSRLEAEFSALYPEAVLSVEYLRPEKVYEIVLADGADLGIVSYPEASKQIKAIPWRKEVMVVAAPADHRLAANTFLGPEELNGYDFIGFDGDLPIARELRRFFRKHGVKVNVVMHFDNVSMMKEAVALGTGISILPERVISEEVAEERLIGIPLKSPGLFRPVGVIHQRRKHFNRAARAFLELLEKPPAQELAPLTQLRL